MRFDVLYGRVGSGKTHECIRRIKSLIDAGEKCIMIVPEQFCYRTEKLLVSSIGAISSQTAEVLTFTRLAGRIFSKNSGAVKLPLSAAGKNMLAYRAVFSVKNKLSTYALAAQKSGFADKVMTMISEFKRYGVSSDDLCSLSESVKKPALASKLGDLALIYKKYDELLSDDYSDFEDNLYIASELLEKSEYLKGVHIFIDEFTDFLPQHYKMLEALCVRASSVSTCLCADKALGTQGVFAPASKTYFRLKGMCDDLHVPFFATYMEKNFLHSGNAELLHLEENYTKIKGEKYDDKIKNIVIFESLNTYSEIENAAKHILSLVREGGARWRDITVCCGDEDMYFEPVKMIFARYKIPCFLSQKNEISSHPLVLTILSAIDILVSGFSYESVFAYLKTGFSNIDMRECDLLENYVLATGVSKRVWLDEQPWHYKSGVLEESDENSEIDQIRRRVIAPLIKLRENIGSKHTAAHACEAIYNFVYELGIGEKTAKLIEEFKAQGEFVNANMYTRIWNSILDILDQIVLTTGDKKIGMEQFKNLLETGFLKEEMGIIPQSADAVSIVTVSDVRAQQCEYLFALGTNVGVFANAASAEGILSDYEREIIKDLGTQLAPTAREALFDTRFLIYKAITRPTKKLFLSYALAKMEGVALPESQVCRNVREIFSNISVCGNIAQNDNEKIFLGSPDSTFCDIISYIGSEEDEDEFLSQVYGWYKSNECYAEKIDRFERAISYNNEAKKLLPHQIRELYPNGINTSVSRLERYSKCPFSYFIEYTLKAKERKILKIGAPDIGSIMHAVLERFIKKIECEKLGWAQISEEYIESAITLIVDEMSEKLLQGSALAGKSTQYILLRLKRSLIRCAKLLITHIASGKFEPVGSEVKFGDGGEISAVVVDLVSGKKMRIHGMIDRIDKCETSDGTYYRVIDYKSGNKSFSLENIYNKLDLQLVVYLDAAMQNKKDALPAGMLYFNIREPMTQTHTKMSDEEAQIAIKESMKLNGLLLNDPEVIRDMDRNYENGSEFLPISLAKSGEIKITSSLATMSQFKALSEYVKTSLKQIGKNILSGKIDIMPYKNGDMSPCMYCAYKPVCKFDAQAGENGYRMCIKPGAANIWEAIGKGRR